MLMRMRRLLNVRFVPLRQRRKITLKKQTANYYILVSHKKETVAKSFLFLSKDRGTIFWNISQRKMIKKQARKSININHPYTPFISCKGFYMGDNKHIIMWFFSSPERICDVLHSEIVIHKSPSVFVNCPLRP